MSPRTLLPIWTLTACLVAGGVAHAQPQPATETLREGAEGQEVRAAQARLVAHGFAVAVDGDYGPRTQAAVVAFQRARGLSPDGVVGPRTWAALRADPPAGGVAGAEDRLQGRRGQAPTRIVRPVLRKPQEARARAQAWARRAQAAGNRTLLVAYEGMWSYSNNFTRRMYGYQDALRQGNSSYGAPKLTAMSFVSKNLLGPTLPRWASRVELLILPETSENVDRDAESPGLQTVLGFRDVMGSRLKVVLVGHSFGAYSALRLANRMARQGVPVAHFLAIDARTFARNYRHFGKPRNVGTLFNYFQKGLLPGYAIQGANLNQRLRGTHHGGIPGERVVRQRLLTMLRE